MNRRVAGFLYAFAGWTVFVWAVFIRNVAKDHTHSTGFKVVHITLAVISLLFAAGTIVVVRRVSRGALSRGAADRAGSGPVPDRTS